MRRGPGLLARCGVAALVAACATAADAGEAPVVVGEVASRVARPDVDLPAALRGALEREIAGLDLRRAPPRRRWVLSALLARMDTETTARAAQTSCTVSATLRAEKSGAIVALLEGRARVDGEAPRVRWMELAAVRAAARGAVARVPEALR